MCGKRVNLAIFIATISLLGVVYGYVIENANEENPVVNDEYLAYPSVRQFQNNRELSQSFDRSYRNKRGPGFTPYISIGALSNMQQFFKNLKDNFHSLENLSDDQARALLGGYRQTGECDVRKWKSTSSTHPQARKHSYNKGLRVFRPPATAAYLHAIRNSRPSKKIRKFVANSEPALLRGSNQYNPSYLWTGLGRRR